ncbi:hypothetical protein GEMRC1_001574 [Eukaryota sp. GEM-RC1]
MTSSVSLLLIGDSGVGKTSLLHTFLNGEFPANTVSTIGINYMSRVVSVRDKSITLRLFDTGGQERFRSITLSSFRQAQAVIFVFDVTNRSSFESMSSWIQEAQSHCPENFQALIVGNKTDLTAQRVISTTQAEEFAVLKKMPYFDTSAKLNDSVVEVFETIADLCVSAQVESCDSDETLNLLQRRSGCGC